MRKFYLNLLLLFFVFFFFFFFIFSWAAVERNVDVFQVVYSCGDGVCNTDYGENYENCPQDCPTSSPTPTPTPTPSPTPTPTPTASERPHPPPPTPSPTPTISPTPTPTLTPSPSPSPSPTIFPSQTILPSPTPTPTVPPLPTITPFPPISPTPLPPTPTFTGGPTYIPPTILPFIPSFPEFVKEVVVSSSKVIIFAGFIVYSLFSLLGLMPHAKTIGDLLFLPFRIFSLFFAVRKKYWGVVYDSVSKQPLDPAIVILKDEKGKKLKTQITDLYGRYSFLVKPGFYYLEARKTNYRFPSQILKDKNKDEIYDNLYHGELIKVDKTQVLMFNIPMDPLAVDWNEVAKKKYLKFNYHLELIKKHLPSLLFYLGFILTLVFYLLSPVPFNRNLLILYLVLMLLRFLGFKPREYGFVLKKKEKKPVPFSVLTVFFEGLEYPVKKVMSDEAGRYHLLVEKGNYSVKISEKEAEGLKDIGFIKKVPAPKGIIKKDFKV